MARIRSVVGALVCISLVLGTGLALAQWYPQQPQQPYPQQPQQPYPQQPQQPYPQTPQYPQAPSYPGGPAPSAVPQGPAAPGMPPSSMPGAGQPGGQTFTDAFGRFRVNFPQGTMPVGAMYNFMQPAAMAQIAIQAVGHEQMFQMNLQNFPAMMRQMGATVEPEQPMNVRGKQARLLTATMRDQQSGTAMRSLNVFISEANLWIQVMGPEQNAAQLQQTLQAILAGLQF
jgi:hypothetical protein